MGGLWEAKMNEQKGHEESDRACMRIVRMRMYVRNNLSYLSVLINIYVDIIRKTGIE